MPFVTEEIWEHIPHEGQSLVVAEYPETVSEFDDQEAITNMEMLIELIRSVRSIRLDANRPLSKKIDILIKTKGEKEKAFLVENRSFIERFCNPNELVIDTEVEIPGEVKSTVISGAEVYLPLAGLVDIQEEIQRLEQEKAKWQQEMDRVEKKLANEKFVQNAPEKIVNAEKEKGQDYKEKYEAVTNQIKKLKQVKEG
jgi:valyl-tRNA synthetase